MGRFALVCLAGACGTGIRYLVALATARWLPSATVPWGTLAVNVVGCFLIAIIMDLAITTTLVPPTLRFVLATGFIGGLTTYSAFNYEATKLFQDRGALASFGYVAMTLVSCAIAGLVGAALTARLSGGR